VLTAYGWTDLVPLVPAFTVPYSDTERRNALLFEDAVIDRLFALNAERAAQEYPDVDISSQTRPKRSPKRKKAKNRAPRLPLDAQDD
jgi:hypothetical protein